MERTTVDILIPAIVTWIGDHDSYATKTKLLKLLYLFDVEYYRNYQQTFTRFSWKFFHLGPWAAEYDPALMGLLAHGIISQRHAKLSEHDTALFQPADRVGTRSVFSSVRDESILLNVLKQWGTCTTGEILNYVYFKTEPMEAATRNQPLDFSLILAGLPSVYTRPSSGKSPAEIRKLRAEFERQLAKNANRDLPPFKFTRPKYDEEYFEAMAKLESV
jgi:hypothetical protein